jgi:hypothetical protein
VQSGSIVMRRLLRAVPDQSLMLSHGQLLLSWNFLGPTWSVYVSLLQSRATTYGPDSRNGNVMDSALYLFFKKKQESLSLPYILLLDMFVCADETLGLAEKVQAGPFVCLDVFWARPARCLKQPRARPGETVDPFISRGPSPLDAAAPDSITSCISPPFPFVPHLPPISHSHKP